jgi:alcohol dehydrogenase (nicotinoprotein)
MNPDHVGGRRHVTGTSPPAGARRYDPAMTESKAAVLTATGSDWEIHDLTVAAPREGEVLIKLAYAGLCYSDEHLRFDKNARLPIVGGHEGSGVVQQTGPGVTGLQAGDHVALTFVTVCGRCHWCSRGRGNLCESGGRANVGQMADGSFRFGGTAPGFPSDGLGGFCGLGTFSQFAVISQNACVKVDPAVPLRAVALVSCGVMTGWGSAVHTAGTQIGDTVVVVGAGGIGLNAVQGARQAGAAAIIAVDPVQAKRDLALELGATHAVATAPEAAKLAAAANPAARGADAAIVAVGNLTTEIITQAFRTTGRGGTLVIAGLSHDALDLNVQVPGTVLAATERRVVGSFVGSCNPRRDIPLLLGLYQRGQLQLDQLVSRHYALEEITAGYADLASGKNIRGVIEFAA